MAAGKWIGGFIGWMAGGPLGALAGYLVGSLFDSMLDGVNTPENSGTWGAGSQRSQGYQDYSQMYQQAYRQRQQQGQRNSFLFSLLVLSSYIIKADGKAMHSVKVTRSSINSLTNRSARDGSSLSRPSVSVALRSVSRWTTRSVCSC